MGKHGLASGEYGVQRAPIRKVKVVTDAVDDERSDQEAGEGNESCSECRGL